MPEKRCVALMLDLKWPYRWHQDVFVGTQQYADQCGTWDCVLDEYAGRTLAACKSRSAPYRGVIARANAELARHAARLGVPVVNVWFSSKAAELPCVAPDFRAMGRLAAEHFLHRGLRRFACLSPRTSRSDRLTRSGFHERLQAEKLSCNCAIVAQQFEWNHRTWQATLATLDRWIDSLQPPVGVLVTFGGIIDRQVARSCTRHGLRVPEDAAIITGINDEALMGAPPPSLSSIDVCYKEVGFQAAALLDRLMDGQSAPEGPLFLPPRGIVARQSTDFFAVEDQFVADAMQFMLRESHRPIGVEDVARAVFATTRTLQRRFQKARGCSVGEELRRLRLERAKRRLAGSEDPIKNIAHECGFQSSVRMGEVFRRELGCSPGEYRARMQSAQLT